MTEYYVEVLTSDGLRVMKFDSVRGGFVESYPILKLEKKAVIKKEVAPAVHERREVKKVKVLPDANLESSVEKEEGDVIKFLQYLDKCAEEVRFLDPALEQARTGRYEQKKPPKPDKKKEAQKPFWTVIMLDERVPFSEKNRYFLKWLKTVGESGKL
ncbi:MAG: hypothetical protein QW707_07170 [Candidatus Bathyarchaeia archaeon]